ncbi:MAG: bifunctional 5,10-methylene-tetrahydrofolate dehydrogenase/5,10-methylene-tetrahydrofolate cyclohydrolase [Treponema sp.]|jgi:methylenetetrahydrofolate dehydrogenase (NADP+)/methenyltetrahydrofolate cyclohydrolase|nr:bifunctional 5,10-methylene-tetrahydrofolate dehydrogenase/5,10-methylene-tetrahydrofolate cyclohydrolase [Treponema sp.]
MAAIVIDGKAIAAKLLEDVRLRVAELKKTGVLPCLAVILVGEDPGSVSYVKAKQKALTEAGMDGWDLTLHETAPEAELHTLIARLNADERVHGILVQLPLPAHINEDRIIRAIDPHKDVDCFHPLSMGKLLMGQPGFLPCTPHGVLVLLKEMKIPVSGSQVVIVGRSNIVGKPLAMLLARKEYNATVTICHTGTKDLASYTRMADILIAAAGSPGLITGDMIKPGAAVIDVGVNAIIGTHLHSHLVGDVLFDEAQETAGWITPVPGGVGPMTIAMLMHNVLHAAEGK